MLRAQAAIILLQSSGHSVKEIAKFLNKMKHYFGEQVVEERLL